MFLKAGPDPMKQNQIIKNRSNPVRPIPMKKLRDILWQSNRSYEQNHAPSMKTDPNPMKITDPVQMKTNNPIQWNTDPVQKNHPIYENNTYEKAHVMKANPTPMKPIPGPMRSHLLAINIQIHEMNPDHKKSTYPENLVALTL